MQYLVQLRFASGGRPTTSEEGTRSFVREFVDSPLSGGHRPASHASATDTPPNKTIRLAPP